MKQVATPAGEDKKNSSTISSTTKSPTKQSIAETAAASGDEAKSVKKPFPTYRLIHLKMMTEFV